MKNLVVDFDKKEANERAEKNFIENCGFDLTKEKHCRMMKDGLNARNQGIEDVHIRALLSSYGKEAFKEGRIIIDGTAFTCKAFEQVTRDKILRIYPYIITAGGLEYSDNDNILEQLYSDIWGTAYIDAGRAMLEEYLKIDAGKDYPGQIEKTIFLTNSFGPGFYGMMTSQTKEFCKILDAQKIGIEVRDSGIMVPLKTCAGIYMIVNDRECIPHPNCQQCIGNPKGCHFCRIRNEQIL